MYIDDLCGKWIDVPFWKTAFKLKNKKDLANLQNCGVKQVWIDTARGLDVETNDAVPTSIIVPDMSTNEQPQLELQVSLENELEAARKIQQRATEQVISMFQQARMGKALQAESAIPITNEIYQSVVRNPGALISLTRLKTKDDYTYMHSVAVSALMIALGRQLGVDEDIVKSLGIAGLLHDVGKMAVPDQILNKPGKLTDEEFDIIKSHPEHGLAMLKDSTEIDDIARDVCLHHHERVDGTGYPEKSSAEDLSLFAKMGAVCDVYDAITSNRSYKDAWEPADSIRKMASWKEGHFDEAVFNAFVKTVGIYPAGTLVKLSSGRLGVVTDQSAGSLLEPKVKIFYSTTAKAHILPKIVELRRSGETIENIADPIAFGIDLKKIIGF